MAKANFDQWEGFGGHHTVLSTVLRAFSEICDAAFLPRRPRSLKGHDRHTRCLFCL